MTARELSKKLRNKSFNKKRIALFTTGALLALILFGVIYIFALDESTWGVGEGLDTTLVTGSADNVVITESAITLGADSTWLDLGWNYKKSLEIKNISDTLLPKGDTVVAVVDTSSLESVQGDCDDLRVGYVQNGEVREIPRDIQPGSNSTSCLDSTDTKVAFRLQEQLQSTSSVEYVQDSEFDNGYVLFYGNADIANTVASTPKDEYLTFNNVSDYVQIGENNDFQITDNDFTIELWFKIDELSSVLGRYQYLLTKAYLAGELENTGWTVYLEKYTNRLRFAMMDNVNAPHYLLSDESISLKEWHHVAARFDSTAMLMTMYVDGVKQTSEITPPSTSDSVNTKLTIGAYSAGTPSLDGSIDEIRIWKKVLTEEEIIANYTFPTSSSPSNLEEMYANWNFDSQEGQSIIDASGNGNDGFLGPTNAVDVNDPTWSSSGTSVYNIDDTGVTLACALKGTLGCVDDVSPTSTPTIFSSSSGGSAIETNGTLLTADRVQGPVLPELSQYTIEFYVKDNGNVNSYAGVYGGWGGFNSDDVNTHAWGVGLLSKPGNIEPLLYTGDFGLNNGEWHHVAMVYDGSEFRIYINGVLKVNSTRIIPITSRNFCLGARCSVANRGFRGSFDEFRISSTPRYTTDFTPPNSSFQTDENTLVLYHFDENGMDSRLSSVKTTLETAFSKTGDAVVYDASGNENHGLVIGAKYTNKNPIGSSAIMSHEAISLEEGVTNKVPNPSFENTIFDTLWSKGYENLDIDSGTFTAKMAKRNGGGPFASGVTVQGNGLLLSDPNDFSDQISVPLGSNVAGKFYQNFDASQGSIAFWTTPEWDVNDGEFHYFLSIDNFMHIGKTESGRMRVQMKKADESTVTHDLVSISSWLPGETHLVVVRWDINNTFSNGTHMSVTVDNETLFSGTTLDSVRDITGSLIRIGSAGDNLSSESIIEGLTVYRRVLYDGTYGTQLDNGNEISQIYNSGNGKDPTEVTGSWDVVLALPTDGTVGELSTTNQAWSMPHSSNLLGTGGFLLGGSIDTDAWSKSLNYVGKFGGGGSAEGKFSLPAGISFDSSDNIYIVDRYNSRVQVFDSGGLFLRMFGSNGAGDGQFNQPQSVSVDSQGNIYVTDRNNSRVQKFDNNGTFLLAWGSEGAVNGQFNDPMGVAVDEDDYVYVTDMGNDRVQVFDSSGNFVRKWGVTGVGDGQFSTPWTIEIDETLDRVYVGDYSSGRVQAFSKEGVYVLQFGTKGYAPGQFDRMEELAIDTAGNIYVQDYGNFRIQVFDSSGNFITTFGSKGDSDGQFPLIPRGIGVNSQNEVFVGANSNYIYRFKAPTISLSSASGENIFSGGYQSQSYVEGGLYKEIDITTGQDLLLRGIAHSDGTSIPRLSVYDVTNGMEISHLDGTSTSTKENPDNLVFTAEGTLAGPSGGTITLDSNPVDGDTVEVGGVTYTFSNDLRNPGVGEILVGTDSTKELALYNLYNAIKGTEAEGSVNRVDFMVVDSNNHLYVSDGLNSRILVFDEDEKYLRGFGTYGSEDGQFNSPSGIALDTEGNIYISDRANDRIQVFDNEGNFLRKFGGYGSENGQLQDPRGIILDNENNIYVVDSSNNRVQIFDNQGNFLRKFGAYGTGVDQFNYPAGIALDAGKNIYVTDYYNNTVKKFDNSGNYLSQLGIPGGAEGQFSTPWAVVIDSEGYIYVGELGNRRFQIFNAEGNFIVASKYGERPHVRGVGVSEDGRIYITDSYNNEIAVYDNTATLERVFGFGVGGDGVFKYTSSIAKDSNDNIYVTDRQNYRVQVLTKDGTFIKKFGTQGNGDGQFKLPEGIALDSNGNIYVADTGNHRIQIFDNDGRFLRKFGSYGSSSGLFNAPVSVALDTDENIYVVDKSNHRVQIFDNNGNYLRQFGSAGSGEGQFNQPRGLSLDSSGNIYVSDYINDRIQVFDNSGNYLRQFGSVGSEDGQIDGPWGSYMDEVNGLFYVTDYNNARVGVFIATTGAFVKNITTTSSLSDVIVFEDGNIYVVQFYGPSIFRYTSEGASLGSFSGWDASHSQSWGYAYGSGSSSNSDISPKDFDLNGLGNTTLNLVSNQTGLTTNNITLSKVGTSITVSDIRFTGGTDNSSKLRVSLLNGGSAISTVNWDQVEVYNNLMDNPSLERGTEVDGNWTPSGWYIFNWDNNIQAGDVLLDESDYWSGSGSVYSAENTDRVGIGKRDVVLNSPYHYAISAHMKTTNGQDLADDNKIMRNDGSGLGLSFSSINDSLWHRYNRVVKSGGGYWFFGRLEGAAFLDDLSILQMNAVDLSLVPSSYANSQTADGGVTVNGKDTFAVPVDLPDPDNGIIRFDFIPSQDNEDVNTDFYNDYVYILDTNTESRIVLYYNQTVPNTLRFDINHITYTTPNVTFNKGERYSVEIGYNAGATTYVKINGETVIQTTEFTGFTTTGPTTLYMGSRLSGDGVYDATFYPYPSSTVSVNSNQVYTKFGSKSVNIVTGSASDEYLTELDLGNTNTHTISAYVFNNTTGAIGSTVDNTVAQLIFNNEAVTTTYTNEGGGWYRLSSIATGVVGTSKYGVQVKGDKNVYIDGVMVNENPSSEITVVPSYCDGSLGDGHSWSGVVNESTSTRVSSGALQYSNLDLNPENNTVAFWMKLEDPLSLVSNGRLIYSIGDTSLYRNPAGNTNTLGISNGGYLYYEIPTLNSNNWYFVTITDESSSDPKLYINGLLVEATLTSGTIPDQLFSTDSTVTIGESNTSISNFRVFENTLSADQIAQIYKQGTSTYKTGSVSNGKYAVEGAWTSQVIDLGNNGQWGATPALQITDNKGEDNIIYQTRTSPDNETWSEYQNIVVTEGGYDFSSMPNRYMQVKAILQSSNQSTTPQFNGMSFNYIQDTVKPSVNASNIQYFSQQSGGSLETPNDWTSISTPYISWSEGQDDVGGSGLRGYCLYLGQDVNADPAEESGLLSSTSPIHTTETNCQFIIDTPYIDLSNEAYQGETWMNSSNSDYYFKVKAVDYTGNVYGADELDAEVYTFKLDNTVPENPKGISAPQEYQRELTSFRMFWAETGTSAALDAHSGVKGYQYRIGEDGIWYGSSHTGNEDCDDLLTETNYTLQEVFEGQEIGDELDIGENVFYVRTWDNICNVTDQYSTAILQFSADAPSKPQNLTVDPTENTQNEFSFDWDIPETFSGQEEGLEYCYTVNSLPSAIRCNWTSSTMLNADAYANQPSENILYLVTKDEAGNVNYDDYATVKFYANTSAPGIVQNLEISDISIKSSSKWKLALAWDQPEEAGAGVSTYEIFRSGIEDSNYNEDSTTFQKIGTTSGESYTDVSLEQKEYYYVVKACDSANNCSAASNTVSMLPTGRYYVPAEIITNPTTTHISTRSATIDWVTERECDSKIQYGVSPGEYFEEEISNSSLVIEHTLTLNNLDAGTTYYYRTKWTDEDGNTGVTDEMTFKTQPPPSVKEVEETYVNLNNAGIRFTTTGASKVAVYYGKDNTLGGVTMLETSPLEATYTVTLTELEDGTKYLYKINLFDLDGNEYDGTVLLDFTTPPKPEVYNVQIQESRGTAQPTVGVTWESNTEINSIVRFYPTGREDLVQNRVDIELIKGDHSMELSGLLPTTTYVMTVEGTDKLGNSAVSDTHTFTTATDTRPPVIYDLKVDKSVLSNEIQPDKNRRAQLIVSWKTDEPSTSQVMFDSGLGDEYGQRTQIESNLKTEHVAIISNLSPSTVYHLQAVSLDSADNEGVSSKLVAVTPKATNTVFEVVVESLGNVFNFLR